MGRIPTAAQKDCSVGSRFILGGATEGSTGTAFCCNKEKNRARSDPGIPTRPFDHPLSFALILLITRCTVTTKRLNEQVRRNRVRFPERYAPYAYSLLHGTDFTEPYSMAKRTAVARTLDNISEAVPHLIRLPDGKAWIDYDEDADVLYISLKRPQRATDTKVLSDKGILLRYRNKDLVGVTVLDASKPRKRKKA